MFAQIEYWYLRHIRYHLNKLRPSRLWWSFRQWQLHFALLLLEGYNKYQTKKFPTPVQAPIKQWSADWSGDYWHPDHHIYKFWHKRSKEKTLSQRLAEIFPPNQETICSLPKDIQFQLGHRERCSYVQTGQPKRCNCGYVGKQPNGQARTPLN